MLSLLFVAFHKTCGGDFGGHSTRYNLTSGSEEYIHLNLRQIVPQRNVFILLNGERATRCRVRIGSAVVCEYRGRQTFKAN